MIRMIIVFMTVVTWSLTSDGSGAYAQTFKGSAIVGLNAGQIDGDFEVGYNKLGVSTGIGIGVNVSKQVFVGTEFLYSQRGSKGGLFRQDGIADGFIRLDYIELPVLVRILDWYQEDDDYNKVWLEAGVSAGRLILANVEGNEDPDLESQFNNTDVSFLVGAGYSITKNFGVSLRYTRAMYPFYRAENPQPLEVESLISYFLTLRVTYTL